MKSQAMQYFHMPYLTLTGLMIFFIFFSVMMLFVLQKKRGVLYEYLGNLPLEDDR